MESLSALSVFTDHVTATMVKLVSDDNTSNISTTTMKIATPRPPSSKTWKNKLKTWLTAGDQVIVGGDFNLGSHFRMTCLQCLNAITRTTWSFNFTTQADFHSTSDKPTVNKRTVNGIFGTSNLIPIRAGYLELGEFLGNHHPIWFDVSYQNALGHQPPKFDHPSMRRLQLHDPKCVAHYTAELKKWLPQHRIPAQTLCPGKISPCQPRRLSHPRTSQGSKCHRQLEDPMHAGS